MERVWLHSSKKKVIFNFRIILAVIFVIAVFILSMFMGRYRIHPMEVVQLLSAAPSTWLDTSDTSVFYYIRLPRVIMAGLVGAALSASGALFQGMFRNPLVSPDILGVSSGCCFGAAMGILISNYFYHPYLIPVMAFIFGILAMMAAYGIAKVSRGEQVVMLILAGMVVGGFFSAALSFVKYIADPYEDLPAIVFWIMGGFFQANWDMVFNLFFTLVPCMVLLYLLSWRINVMSLGDEEASALGVNVRRLRLTLLGLATFMVASSVSAAGTIGWVGLVVPHIARMLVGPDHKLAIPMSIFMGAGFVMLMDNLARCLTSSEIPISILTAAIGTPFFAYLLIKGKGNAWK